MGILLSNFQNKLSSLTDAELSAFDLLDNRPELLLSSNLTELADSLYSSNSTIIRLTQKLDFEGFRDFKQAVKQLIKETNYPSQQDLINNYQDFFSKIADPDNNWRLQYFAQQIHEAKNIFTIGVGLTKPVAEYMSKHLYQLDRTSVYVYESHMLDLLPNLVKRGDLVLFFSMSGETKSVLDAAGKVTQTGCTMLSITNAQQNALNRLTQYSITSDMPTNFYHNYDVTSRGFLLAIADLICDRYLKQYLKKPEKE